jgi:hypothetical protein
MNLVRFVTSSMLFGLVACSSSGPIANSSNSSGGPSGTNGGDNGGLEGDGEGAAGSAPDTNPDGVAYPTENVGITARKGTTPGNRISNYKFLGFPNGDTAGGLKPISLAQYFDPTGKKYELIHIQASGVWCSPCRAEMAAVGPLKNEFEKRKVVWLVSLSEGPSPGKPSTEKDLKGWIAEFGSTYTHFIDPGNKNLGVFYDEAAIPWNSDIDARTMEVLTSGTGAEVTETAILEKIDKALELAQTSTLRSRK